jgi:hypothetical protein
MISIYLRRAIHISVLECFVGYVGFEVLTAVTMKSTIFWNVTPCNVVDVY